MNITEDYVSYEVAKLLKEKGFDIPLNYFYNSNGKRGYATSYNWNQTTGDFPDYSCPTLQMAMKWLREVYKLSIEPYSIAIEENCIGYAYAICSCKTGLEIFAEWWDGKNPFVSYEEAVEAALKYSLENLI